MVKLKALSKFMVPATMVTAILFSSGASSEVLANTSQTNDNTSNAIEITKLNQELENLFDTNVIFKKLEETGEKKKVTISLEGEQRILETTAKTVAMALIQSGIEISENDEVYPSIDSEIPDGGEILILTKNKSEFKKTIAINFNVSEEFSIEVPYGERKIIQKGQNGEKVQSYKQELKNGIIISEEMISEEIVSKPIDEKVIVGLKEVVQEGIEFDVETQNNPSLEKGKTKVIQKGVAGKKESVYRNDGKSRVLISSEIISQPQNKIVEIGTKEKVKVTYTAPAEVGITSAKYSLSQFKFNGVVHDSGRKFTYYSQSVLPGGGLKIPGRHVNSGGYVADASGYIVLAAGRAIPHGTVINTPFGYKGKVYDTCASCDSKWFDVYIR